MCLLLNTCGNRQLGILFGFSNDRQLAVGAFFGFRENCLDFKQPAIGNIIRICNQQSGILSGFWAIGSWGTLSKMHQKRIPKRASKNNCFPLKTGLGLQNPLRTRSLTPLKIDHKSSLILEGRKLKNKQTLHTFPHFLNFKAIKNHPNTFPKAVLNCLSAFDNRISYLDTGASGN